MRQCPACQHPLEISDAAFCSFCGASLYPTGQGNPAAHSPTPLIPSPTISPPPPGRTYVAPPPHMPIATPDAPLPRYAPAPTVPASPPPFSPQAGFPGTRASSIPLPSIARATWVTIGVIASGLVVSLASFSSGTGLYLVASFWIVLILLRRYRPSDVYAMCLWIYFATAFLSGGGLLLLSLYSTNVLNIPYFSTSAFGYTFVPIVGNFVAINLGLLFAYQFARWDIIPNPVIY